MKDSSGMNEWRNRRGAKACGCKNQDAYWCAQTGMSWANKPCTCSCHAEAATTEIIKRTEDSEFGGKTECTAPTPLALIEELVAERDAAIQRAEAAEKILANITPVWHAALMNFGGESNELPSPTVIAYRLDEAKSTIATQAEEIRVMREALEKAPHGDDCQVDLCARCDGRLLTGPIGKYCQCRRPRPQPCNCWKSALAAVPQPAPATVAETAPVAEVDRG